MSSRKRSSRKKELTSEEEHADSSYEEEKKKHKKKKTKREKTKNENKSKSKSKKKGKKERSPSPPSLATDSSSSSESAIREAVFGVDPGDLFPGSDVRDEVSNESLSSSSAPVFERPRRNVVPPRDEEILSNANVLERQMSQSTVLRSCPPDQFILPNSVLIDDGPRSTYSTAPVPSPNTLIVEGSLEVEVKRSEETLGYELVIHAPENAFRASTPLYITTWSGTRPAPDTTDFPVQHYQHCRLCSMDTRFFPRHHGVKPVPFVIEMDRYRTKPASWYRIVHISTRSPSECAPTDNSRHFRIHGTSRVRVPLQPREDARETELIQFLDAFDGARVSISTSDILYPGQFVASAYARSLIHLPGVFEDLILCARGESRIYALDAVASTLLAAIMTGSDIGIKRVFDLAETYIDGIGIRNSGLRFIDEDGAPPILRHNTLRGELWEQSQHFFDEAVAEAGVPQALITPLGPQFANARSQQRIGFGPVPVQTPNMDSLLRTIFLSPPFRLDGSRSNAPDATLQFVLQRSMNDPPPPPKNPASEKRSTIAPRPAKEEDQELAPDKGRTCCLCLTYKSTHIVDPCGHRVCCDWCANDICDPKKGMKAECPLCREPIVKFLRIKGEGDEDKKNKATSS